MSGGWIVGPTSRRLFSDTPVADLAEASKTIRSLGSAPRHRFFHNSKYSDKALRTLWNYIMASLGRHFVIIVYACACARHTVRQSETSPQSHSWQNHPSVIVVDKLASGLERGQNDHGWWCKTAPKTSTNAKYCRWTLECRVLAVWSICHLVVNQHLPCHRRPGTCLDS